jgi:MFS family permease
MSPPPGTDALRLGLRANLGQFSLLVLINAFVGAMVGLERTVVPLIGEREFGLSSKTAIVSFIVSFGVTKALLNLVAARLAERFGRKPILVAGWLLGLPVPFMIMWAPSWGWIDAANILLGANQAFAWSMTVIMKVDLVGPQRRGLALGLNEFAGYLSVALSAWATGSIASRYALRPEPFYYGGVVAALGLGLSVWFVRETRGHVSLEIAQVAPPSHPTAPATSFGRTFAVTTWRDRNLAAACQAGLVNNLNDGMSWGIYPLFFGSYGLGVAAIGVVKAVYPGVWGMLQVVTGPLSDRIGRKGLIAGGMLVQATGIWVTVLVPTYPAWIMGAVLQGLGTAMVYPTLVARDQLRRVPPLARPRLRRGRAPRGARRGLARHGHRHPRRRGPHAGLRRDRDGADAGDPRPGAVTRAGRS